MNLIKRYHAQMSESYWQNKWQIEGIYQFDPQSRAPLFSIDTPPPTVSGHLHLGHVYHYSHADFIARFKRMNGHNVFYPMGYDDNGLPTERLVEQQLGLRASDFGREEFVQKCLQISSQVQKDYQALWKRLGLSIDWRYTYRTIDERSQRISQFSFLDLYQKGLIYQKKAPTIWCPECGTAIAQAELNDLDQVSDFLTIKFNLINHNDVEIEEIPIATTRPELLPACVAIFVHPDDTRYQHLVGETAKVPLFEHLVPILSDPDANPEKGTGIVMCCTFGDTTDISWWQSYNLPLIEVLNPQGCLTKEAGILSGLEIKEARKEINNTLAKQGLLIDSVNTIHSLRVHERCDTPIEYIVTPQWFIRILDFKDQLLKIGEKVNWYPTHMSSRYKNWVENLSWDWCISRQRYFGVTFPVWFCKDCGETILARESQLPVNPLEDQPEEHCPNCEGCEFTPEEDVMDTWATSSLSPQIVAGWLSDDEQYNQLFPMSMRPQAHGIIRTWAFYTLTKSYFHFAEIPWKDVFISGWGIAGKGMEKISKSRGGGPMPPIQMIEKYSADSVRYWAASVGPGKDAVISEEKVKTGVKLTTKMWNVARFCAQFLDTFTPTSSTPSLTPADAWILSKAQTLIKRVTNLFNDYEYAAAKNEIELYFWSFTDNYLEMAKQRLYDKNDPQREGTRFTLYYTLLTLIKLFAPLMPYITEEIYQAIFYPKRSPKTIREDQSDTKLSVSLHISPWPVPNERYMDHSNERFGDILVEIATAVRRYKSENGLSLGTSIKRLQISTDKDQLSQVLQDAASDIMSVCRAENYDVVQRLNPNLECIYTSKDLNLALC